MNVGAKKTGGRNVEVVVSMRMGKGLIFILFPEVENREGWSSCGRVLQSYHEIEKTREEHNPPDCTMT